MQRELDPAQHLPVIQPPAPGIPLRRSTFGNSGSIRSNTTYGPGALTKRDVLSILPFENPIVKIEVKGATLRAALEHGVSRSGPREPGWRRWGPTTSAQTSGAVCS